MATSFQPEKPHDEAKGTRGRGTYIAIAIVSALMVMMLQALAAPRMFEEEGTNWVITIGIGVFVFIAIFAYGLSRTKGNQPHQRDV